MGRVVLRPALFERLSAAGRVTEVSAPPGSGKTQLLRSWIAESGLARTRVGGAEVSDQDANYIVVHPGAAARDVLRLIDLVRSRVQERFNLQLEPDISVW